MGGAVPDMTGVSCAWLWGSVLACEWWLDIISDDNGSYDFILVFSEVVYCSATWVLGSWRNLGCKVRLVGSTSSLSAMKNREESKALLGGEKLG